MLSTQAGYQNGWYLYDGLARGGKVDYVGNVHQCIHLEYAHIFLYEQCLTNANVYGKTSSYEKEKLSFIISFYKNELNLSDTKVKIKNLKAILEHGGISFSTSAQFEDLKKLVLNISERKTCIKHNSLHKSFDINMKTPPQVKTVPSKKRHSLTPTESEGYTPDRHATKKLKNKVFSPLRKSSFNKKFLRCIETFKDLVNKVSSSDNTPTCLSDDEQELFKNENMTDPPKSIFVHLDKPLPHEIQECKSNNYLTKTFSSNLSYQMVDTKELWEFREFDRFATPKCDNGNGLSKLGDMC